MRACDTKCCQSKSRYFGTVGPCQVQVPARRINNGSVEVRQDEIRLGNEASATYLYTMPAPVAASQNNTGILGRFNF
jgi:hypothetical protein